MRGLIAAAIAVLTAGAGAGPAAACALAALPGALALNGTKTAITSEGVLGSVVTVSTTLLDGPFTISFAAPSFDQWPDGFPMGSATLEQKTVTLGTLSMNSAYTTGAISKSFGTQVLSAVVITLHHQITASRYPQGRYRTKTVVTCS